LTGTFAVSPRLSSVVGANSVSKPDYTYGAGDTILFTFDAPTNLGGYVVGQPLSKQDVGFLFNSSVPMGVDYTGSWKSTTQFEVLVLDSGIYFLSTFGDTRATLSVIGPISNPSGTSSRVDPSPIFVSGEFALPPVISAVEASNPPRDATYGIGDTLTITFNGPTNR
jgi:hypothetical protein